MSSGFINALASQLGWDTDFFPNALRTLIIHTGCNPTEFGKNSDFHGGVVETYYTTLLVSFR